MTGDSKVTLQVRWKSERIVGLRSDDDKVVPSLHLWSCAGQSIERSLRTVNPMLAVTDVVRLGVSWC